MGEATRFRCPRCGAETVISPRCGGEVVAVYCLCAGSPDPRRREWDPVRMGVLTAQREAVAA
jgi:hypothetical protein